MDKEKIYADIIKSEPEYDSLSTCSKDAIQFIKSALKKDPTQRASIA